MNGADINGYVGTYSAQVYQSSCDGPTYTFEDCDY